MKRLRKGDVVVITGKVLKFGDERRVLSRVGLLGVVRDPDTGFSTYPVLVETGPGPSDWANPDDMVVVGDVRGGEEGADAAAGL